MERQEVLDKLRGFICQELLGNPDYPLSETEPMITGGLIDSYSLAQIGVFVEENFDIYIPDNDLTVERMDTLKLMVDEIIARGD